MKQVGWRSLILGSLLGLGLVHADPNKAIIETEKKEVPAAFNAQQADWVFSGTVTNESGERYNYYFQLQREDKALHALATLIDAQTKKVLLFTEDHATIEQPESTNWRVGNAFMQFNPITNSWVFGVQDRGRGKAGFNFKVDMLEQVAAIPTMSQDLRTGLELLVNQTGRLNGHLQTGEATKEQFVTASKAWFKQIWVSKPQANLHPLTGILCQFNDGSGFYAVNLPESDALGGAVAGWRDGQGTPVSMSQFVSINEAKDGLWQIRILSPNLRFSLEDMLAKTDEKHQLIAGLTGGKRPGFCAISKTEVGKSTTPT